MVRKPQIGCWLRLHFIQLNDVVLEQISRRIGDLWRDAHETVETRAFRELEVYRAGVSAIRRALGDPDLSDAALRAKVATVIAPLPVATVGTGRAVAIRAEMAARPSRLRALLKAVSGLNLVYADDHPLGIAVTTLGRVYTKGETGLAALSTPFATTPRALIEAATTAEQRLAAYEVATALLLKRSLRNGAASSVHSIKHRSLADQLMPPAQWLKHKGSFAQAQTLPKTLEAYLSGYKATLTSQVAALDAAITVGDIGLRDDRLRIPKLKALGESPEVKATRRALFGAIGAVQLPDILIEIDARTHFSWILLGRQPASTCELTLVYCALLGLGTMQSAASVWRSTHTASPISRWDWPRFWALIFVLASPDFRGANSICRAVYLCPRALSRLSSVCRSAVRRALDGMAFSISQHRSRVDMVPQRPSLSAMAAPRAGALSMNAAP